MWSLRSAACSRRRPWRRWRSALGERRGGAAGARGAGAAGRDSAVLCAAAAVVPRPAGRARARPTRSRLRCGLRGALDSRRWKRALGDVVARHESLRTVFPDARGVPRQEIFAPSAAGCGLRSSDVSEAEPWRRLWRARRGSFDLARELPLRAHVFALAPTSTCCCWCCITLRATAGRWRCWGATWPALCGAAPWHGGRASRAAGSLCRLHAVAARAAGQRERSRQRDCAPAWLLDGDTRGLPEQLDLPCDRARPSVASYRGGRFRSR